MSLTTLLWQTRDLDQALEDQSLEPWMARAYEELRAKILDEAFPCTFGTSAQKIGDLYYAFAEPDDPDRLHQATLAYLDQVRGQPVVNAATTALALFIRLADPPQHKTIEDYHAFGWSILQYFHDHDPYPWPDRIPTDPDDPRWSFAFAGIPIFVNFKTPQHRARRSRQLQNAFLLLIQPRDGFDLIAGDNPPGRHARRIIRRKLYEYDRMPPCPALAHYGQDHNREWQQYALPDDNDTSYAVCPLHIQSRSNEEKR